MLDQIIKISSNDDGKSCTFKWANKTDETVTNGRAYTNLCELRRALDFPILYLDNKTKIKDINEIAKLIFSRYENRYNKSLLQKVEDFFSVFFGKETKLQKISKVYREIINLTARHQNASKTLALLTKDSDIEKQRVLTIEYPLIENVMRDRPEVFSGKDLQEFLRKRPQKDRLPLMEMLFNNLSVKTLDQLKAILTSIEGFPNEYLLGIIGRLQENSPEGRSKITTFILNNFKPSKTCFETTITSLIEELTQIPENDLDKCLRHLTLFVTHIKNKHPFFIIKFIEIWKTFKESPSDELISVLFNLNLPEEMNNDRWYCSILKKLALSEPETALASMKLTSHFTELFSKYDLDLQKTSVSFFQTLLEIILEGTTIDNTPYSNFTELKHLESAIEKELLSKERTLSLINPSQILTRLDVLLRLYRISCMEKMITSDAIVRKLFSGEISQQTLIPLLIQAIIDDSKKPDNIYYFFRSIFLDTYKPENRHQRNIQVMLLAQKILPAISLMSQEEKYSFFKRITPFFDIESENPKNTDPVFNLQMIEHLLSIDPNRRKKITALIKCLIIPSDDSNAVPLEFLSQIVKGEIHKIYMDIGAFCLNRYRAKVELKENCLLLISLLKNLSTESEEHILDAIKVYGKFDDQNKLKNPLVSIIFLNSIIKNMLQTKEGTRFLKEVLPKVAEKLELKLEDNDGTESENLQYLDLWCQLIISIQVNNPENFLTVPILVKILTHMPFSPHFIFCENLLESNCSSEEVQMTINERLKKFPSSPNRWQDLLHKIKGLEQQMIMIKGLQTREEGSTSLHQDLTTSLSYLLCELSLK